MSLPRFPHHPPRSYGRCVNLTAVGENNAVASYRGANVYATMSGTSFSAPLVAGLAATVWSGQPAGTTARAVAATLYARATYGVLPAVGVYATTVNALAYSLPNGGGDLSLSPSPTATPSVSPATATPSSTPAASLVGCPASFLSLAGASGTMEPVAGTPGLSLGSQCGFTSSAAAPKIVVRIDLGAAAVLGGSLTVDTCARSSVDTLLWLGRGA